MSKLVAHPGPANSVSGYASHRVGPDYTGCHGGPDTIPWADFLVEPIELARLACRAVGLLYAWLCGRPEPHTSMLRRRQGSNGGGDKKRRGGKGVMEDLRRRREGRRGGPT